MNKLFGALALSAVLATPAMAADMRMPVKAPPPAPPPLVYNWTGFYIGAHVGYGWGDVRQIHSVRRDPLGAHDIDGFFGGGQVGFDYQVGAWVFGVEADFSGADLSGSHVDPIFFGTQVSKVEWFGTATGRIGYAWDRVLLYAKGGAAWADDVYTITGGVRPGFFAETDKTKSGWTAGAGLEYGFAPNWSVKLEYNYLDFGTAKWVTFVPNGSMPFAHDIDQHFHAVKVGINYRFGGAPIAARY